MQMPAGLAALLRVAGLAAVAALFWRSQLGGGAARLGGSLAAGAAVGWLGWRRGSLSRSGAHLVFGTFGNKSVLHLESYAVIILNRCTPC